MSRIRVGVIFGGRSGEHDVSLASATSLLEALDPDKYEVVPIGITREGHWLPVASPEQLTSASLVAQHQLVDPQGLPGVVRPFHLVRRESDDASATRGVDVVIPVLHGPFGEDGTIQGFLETLDVPYVGTGVLGSALSMDKAAMKAQLEHAGLKSVPWRLILRSTWLREPATVLSSLVAELEYPMFVKPCNMGSSVGISKARDCPELRAGLDGAFVHDRRVIVEQGIDAREVECAVAGNDELLVSVPGEVISGNDYYDYESKYTEGMAELEIPARLTVDQTARVQELARLACAALDVAGLARVDFFVRRQDGEVLLNEVNTMPGFTTTSMYPKLWEASGISYRELLDRLIQYAFERHGEQQRRGLAR